MAECLARHVPSDARLTLALSGGVDSVALLHALLALRDAFSFRLEAVHVHHGLSPFADAWADFCARLCAAHAVGLSVHPVRIAPDDAAGIEAAARRERRRVFSGVDADFLLTAHQQDDQVETLLLQLLRGAGPKGLAAMAGVQRHPGWRAPHLRPLLGVTRAEVLAFAESRGLKWVEDESNQDVRYRRNALRLRVIPLLRAHFPGAGGAVARAAALQAEASQLMEELARIDAAAAVAGGRLDCAALARLSTPRARNLLRHFIAEQGHPMPSARRLDEALHQLLGARTDARVCVRIGAADVRRYRGGAYLVQDAAPLQKSVSWRGEAELALPGAGTLVMRSVMGAGLKRGRLERGVVALGPRKGGERLRLTSGGPRRSLKDMLQERAVPPWLRGDLPLLTCDGELVWAAGIGCNAEWLAADGEPGLVPEWRPWVR